MPGVWSQTSESWRYACPRCGSRSIFETYRSRTNDTVYRCRGTCEAYDIEPVDVKEAGVP